LTRENSKTVSYESQDKASEKHTDQERSQGRKKNAAQVSKSSTQPTIQHIIFKTNGAESNDKEHHMKGTTRRTSAEDGSFLVRYCPTEVDDILNKILTSFVDRLPLL
jgi:hypothetical protein